MPQFYPSMFVMGKPEPISHERVKVSHRTNAALCAVTEILDTFGRLVFERLKSVADTEHMKVRRRCNPRTT